MLHVHPVERNDWVTVLQDCTRGRHQRNTLNPGSPLTSDFRGYLELKGLRSKLYTVVSSDKVFLYKNMEVNTALCVFAEKSSVYKLHISNKSRLDCCVF